MNKQFTSEELQRLRNHISIEILIKGLKIPHRLLPGDLFRFECPRCFGYHTAIHPKTNLARCFTCQENYNSIELVMIARSLSFVASVKLLQSFEIKLIKPKSLAIKTEVRPNVISHCQKDGLKSVGQILQQIALGMRSV